MSSCPFTQLPGIKSLSYSKPGSAPANEATRLLRFPFVPAAAGFSWSGNRLSVVHEKSSLSCKAEGWGTEYDQNISYLTVPDHWLLPSRAQQESEWLRSNLHRWLDEEYCPEPTNVEISKVAAESYYKSLISQEIDLGDILVKMVRDLQAISYQESFHGAFSSANAAIDLIAQRIEVDGQI